MGDIRVGIYGAAGYTAGELFRILIYHPHVRVVCAQSESQAGKPISNVHTDLIGETALVFDSNIDWDNIDVLFMCKGHGESKSYLQSVKVPAHVKIIDLSNDFRLKADADGFVYGLPEVFRKQIRTTSKLANPGCFATCIQLGLLPAADVGLIKSEIHTTGITGSTGAGQSLSSTSHFSWRNSNMSIYKAFTHQHLGEIGETLNFLAGNELTVNFLPFRGNFTRGIYVTSYFDSDITESEAYALYDKYYESHPFVHVTKVNPDLKMVVNTNKAVIYLKKEGKKLLVVSMIDNLLKGASGQAVQNMNLMFGLDETVGLNLKPVGF